MKPLGLASAKSPIKRTRKIPDDRGRRGTASVRSKPVQALPGAHSAVETTLRGFPLSGSFSERIPICEFSEGIGVTPELWQRVVLKLFSGEELDEEPRAPYDISEAEWLELAHSRGRTPQDLYDRIAAQREAVLKDPARRTGFTNILLVCGRRAGKTSTIAVATLYSAYLLLRQANPHAVYGVQEGEPIAITVAALTATQSTKAPYGRIKAILQNLVADRDSEGRKAGSSRGASFDLASYLDDDGIKSDTIYFQTLRDREVVEDAGKLLGTSRRASVQVQAAHSGQDSQRGGANVTTLFDEFGWFPVTNTEDKGETFYDTMIKGQQQFGRDAVNFTLSSPAFQYGKFYELYSAAFSGDLPNTLALQLPSWEACEFEERPRVTLKGLADDEKEPFDWDYEGGQPVEEALEKASPKFRREWGAEFEGVESVWLARQSVERFFNEDTPFMSLQRGGRRTRAYYMHLDAASENDAFAVVVGHIETMEEGTRRTIFDHIHRFYVAPKREYRARSNETVYYAHETDDGVAHIDTEEVEAYVKKLLLAFNVVLLSYDQPGAHFVSGSLRRFVREKAPHTRLRKLNHTYDYNVASAENFRQGVLRDLYKSAPSEIAREELLGLEKDHRGVVAKGRGSLDDIFDCFRAVAWQAREGTEYMEGSSYERMLTGSRSGGPRLMPTPVRGNF